MSVSSKLSIIAPHFDSINNRNDFISLAALQINNLWFGNKSEWANAYLAAHLIAVNPNTGSNPESGGIISAKREGDLSVSYSNSGAMENEDLSRTTYGKQFMALRKQGNVLMSVTGGNDVSVSSG